MRVPNSIQEAQPWVINQIAHDFRLLDVWELPVQGRADEFVSFLELVSSFDPADSGSTVSNALFWVRFRLGEFFGWDDAMARPIPGCAETTLSTRLPEALQGTAMSPAIGDAMQKAASGFDSLYRTDDEWAAEISNATVHAALHFGWVDQGHGRYRGQMSIFVKPRGVLGEAYMSLIGPFRHLIVYPVLMRRIEREWNSRVLR